MNAESSEFITPPAHGWDCFHCGEHFKPNENGQRQARLHFGETPKHTPGCCIKLTHADRSLLARIRDFETRETDLLSEIHEETGRAITALRRRESDHAAEVRRAEEDGYGKGVRDMTEQRDELLAALREARSNLRHAQHCRSNQPMVPPQGFNRYPCDCGSDHVREVATAAIAKASGSAG